KIDYQYESVTVSIFHAHFAKETKDAKLLRELCLIKGINAPVEIMRRFDLDPWIEASTIPW
ncbi:MAG TPA: hypothetical protein DCR17_07800, partial [Verrucomicrobiales bacterium]|nr:hypothetical protein [Verrucomicrobiales bacterium]